MRIPHFIAMLTRRLFRRPGFWVLLALIPALTLVYSAAAREDAGMVTVALARESWEDPLAGDIMATLEGGDGLLHFTACQTPEDAIAHVTAGKANCAWVFHSDMEAGIKAFIASRSQKDAFVTVYQRETTPLLILARERLNAEVYAAIARELYLSGLSQESDALAQLSQEELLAFWAQADIPGQLFAFSYSGGHPLPESYLLSPLRGLLAAVMLVGSLASAMFATRDEEAGIFAFLPQGRRWLPELLSGLLLTLSLGAAALASLWLGGIAQNIFREGLCMAALAAGCTGFSMAVRRIFPRVSAMAALLPVITALALVACPVFFTIEALAPVGALLPASHYLAAVSGAASPGWLVLYSILSFAIALVPKNQA